jgi:hypothetical protein
MQSLLSLNFAVRQPGPQQLLSRFSKTYAAQPTLSNTTIERIDQVKMPAGFLDLPRELRDQIYSEMWASLCTIGNRFSQDRYMVLDADYHLGPYTRGELAISEASSIMPVMLVEAVEEFHRQGHITMKIWTNGWTLSDGLQFDPNHPLSPISAREIWVWMTVMNFQKSLAPDEPPVVIVNPNDIAYLEVLVPLLEASGKIRNLKLFLMPPSISEEHGLDFDLQSLAVLEPLVPHLRYFEINVSDESLPWTPARKDLTEQFLWAEGKKLRNDKFQGWKLSMSSNDGNCHGDWQLFFERLSNE